MLQLNNRNAATQILVVADVCPTLVKEILIGTRGGSKFP
jgi:hypothetical protein